MLMLDLCSGLGSVSQVFKARGWDTITLDIDPQFKSDITADLRTWAYIGERPDLIWCSPPCDEFSREFMPWSRTGRKPDLSIVQACIQVIDEVKPRYWVIENTKGALSWFKPILGNPRFSSNPYFLWGFFPDISQVKVTSHKEHLTSARAAERALIPERLTAALAISIERSIPLFNPQSKEFSQ